MGTGISSGSGHLVTGGGRDLAQLKAEVLRRVERGAAPVGGIEPADARAALERIDSLEREQWASAWSAVAGGHFERGEALRPHDKAGAAAAFWRAWRLYQYARWPTENSPTRVAARDRAIAAFRAYGKLVEPAIETVRIPFGGNEIVAYVRVPAGIGRVPVVLGISGLDSRKEDVVAYSDGYLDNGLAIVAVDMPGTGEAPLKPAKHDGDRMFSAVLDYIAQRADLDHDRVVVQGRSFSGHWAAKLAYTERARLRGAVMHGGAVHVSFQRAWAEPALKTGEYLYDYYEARRGMFGASDPEDLYAKMARFSLVDQGLLDEPSAPMLVMNGARDSQTTIDDVFLLLRHGDAKDAWVNPKGGHMGRSAEWSGARIQDRVIMPWILRRVNA
jgi:pimeloyl-ACP methyl ester carboxylesterase